MRALSAVTRPSASHPAHASTRTGWRLGWTCSDSSRLNVHFTGRPSSQAARAVWAWLAQSSLPPNAPAVGDEVHEDAVLGDAEHVGDLAAVVPHALPAREHLERAVVSGHHERRLGLEEGVLDALGLEHLVDGVGAGGEGGVGVEPFGVVGAGVDRPGQDVGGGRVADLPHGRLGRVEGRERVGERGERGVVDRHQLGGPPGGGPVAGHDEGQDVAGVRRAPADRDEHRPVAVDEPDAQVARHVGGGEDALDAGDGLGRRGVDGEDVGPGVLGEDGGGVEQAGDPHVVDVVLVAERQLAGLVPAVAAADAPRRPGVAVGPLGGPPVGRGRGGRPRDRDLGARGQQVDRVEDGVVAGAAAQVAAEVAGRLVAGQRRRRLCPPGTSCA